MSGSLIMALVLACGAAVGLVFAFQQPSTASNALKRVQDVKKRNPKKDAAEAAIAKRRQNTQEALKTLAAEQKQSRKRQVSIKGRLAQAGLDVPVAAYWGAALSLGAVLGVTGLIVQGSLLGAAAGAFVGALGLPIWVLGMLVGMRQKKFSNQLADAIDMIVRGVKSGLPLNQCMQMIAAESPEPLRSEFKALVDGQAMGVPLEQNLGRMYERMPLAEVNFFNIVLLIQQKTGGNLAESLGNLSGVLRARKMMREKVKALSSEAKASAMIIGALPFIVMVLVYMVRPEYMTLLFTETTGHVILLGAGMMMSTGILVMRNMVNFKF